MNIAKLGGVATRLGGKSALQLKNNAPAILTGVGILGSIASTVLAVRATTKVDSVLEAHEAGVNRAKFNAAEGDLSAKELNKDLTKVYLRTSLRMTKLYGPSVVVGVLSYTSIICGHGMMAKRQAALLAAYATIEQSFQAYRKRVVEAVGEEKEFELRHGVVLEHGKDKEGNESVGIKSIEDPNNLGMHARFFDETNPNWSPRQDDNKNFLLTNQNYFNNILQSRGHLFLNEVFDQLGMERTQAGQVIGWVISEDGDNYVDFGIYNGARPAVRDFVNGNERSILLDFNVDGPILGKI